MPPRQTSLTDCETKILARSSDLKCLWDVASDSSSDAAEIAGHLRRCRSSMHLSLDVIERAMLLRSGVNFTNFLQKWPKIQHSSPKCLQQSMTFQKSSFSWPSVLAYESDGV